METKLYAYRNAVLQILDKYKVVRTRPGVYSTNGGFILEGGTYGLSPAVHEINLAKMVTYKRPHWSSDSPCSFQVGFGNIGWVKGLDYKAIFKGLGSNSLVIGLKLVLAETAPVYKNELEFIQKGLMFAEKFSTDTCRGAASMLSYIVKKTDATTQVLAPALGVKTGTRRSFIDGARAYWEGTSTEEVDKAITEDGKNDVLHKNYNIMWIALRKAGITDSGLINLITSITGTIVNKKVKEKVKEKEGKDAKEKEVQKTIPYPSLVESNQAIETMIFGGANKSLMYKISGENGLDVGLELVALTVDESLYGQIRTALHEMRINLMQGEDVTDQQRAFLGSLSGKLPDLVLNTLGNQYATIDIDIVAQLIACNMVTKYLEVVLSQVIPVLNSLAGEQYSMDDIEKMHENIIRVRSYVISKRNQVAQEFRQQMEMTNLMQQQAKRFRARTKVKVGV